MRDMPLADPPPELEEQVTEWVRGTWGPLFLARNLEVLNGHAGLTYAFEVISGDNLVVDSLVLRLAPPGVRAKGSADVLHQVVPLQMLRSAGFPVAELRYWGDDQKWFGAPYLVVRRVNGHTVGLEEGDPPTRDDFLTAARALGHLHQSLPIEDLTHWEEPRSFEQEIKTWDRALEKTGESTWRTLASQVRGALLDETSELFTLGLCHGDFQFSNLLFEHHEISAVLDWELAGIGPQLSDLGWFMTINDQNSWAHHVALDGRPSDADICDEYERAFGSSVPAGQVSFACAAAAYKFAIIAGFNLHLHRTGRRVDEHWEHLEPSIPKLLTRSLEHLSSRVS